MDNIQRLGIALILSGPSGSGKSSISKEIMKRHPDVAFSISCTTRAPRGTERNGVDYHFLSREDFRKKIEAGDFIEYAEVHGNYYGTLKSEVLDRVTRGIDVILDIDVQGAAKVHELCKTNEIFRDCVEFVFILKRLKNSILEISRWREYSYLLINDDFANAVEKFNALLLAFRMSTKRWKEDINA
mgnify:CR=1 FL=1